MQYREVQAMALKTGDVILDSENPRDTSKEVKVLKVEAPHRHNRIHVNAGLKHGNGLCYDMQATVYVKGM